MQSVTASDSGNEAMGDLVALPCNFRISVETDRKEEAGVLSPAFHLERVYLDDRLRCLTHPHSRVAEHAHPRAIFAPLIGTPGVLHRTEHPLRVRHHDSEATIVTTQTGDAER